MWAKEENKRPPIKSSCQTDVLPLGEAGGFCPPAVWVCVCVCVCVCPSDAVTPANYHRLQRDDSPCVLSWGKLQGNYAK